MLTAGLLVLHYVHPKAECQHSRISCQKVTTAPLDLTPLLLQVSLTYMSARRAGPRQILAIC